MVKQTQNMDDAGNKEQAPDSNATTDLGAPDRSLVGGGTTVRGPAEDALDVEGSAAEESAAGERSSAVHAWLFRADEPPQKVDLEQLPELVTADENFVWVDLSNYEEDDLKRVAEALHLHPLGVHLALARWQRPRLDVFADHFFASATVARLDPSTTRVHASEIDLFVGRNYLVSTHKLPLPFADRVMARAAQNPALVQHDSAFMLYIILEELLAHYEDLQEDVQGDIEHMEERALRDTSDDFLSDLVALKRYTFALSQLAGQHRNVFEAFLRPDFPFTSGEGMDAYYRDLESRLARLLDSMAAAKDAVNGAFDIYVSHVSHRTNQVIKVLTIVSTTLLPITVILGFFGTGFGSVVPLYTRTGFIVMLLCIALVTGSILTAFRLKHWI